MTNIKKQVVKYQPKHHLRFITAASLFDGHDAAINVMRRILQASGAEVIHLAHNRSVAEIVNAALQEDVHAIAISSYQGGHIEFFKYIIDQLKTLGGEHIKVFGGGGGVITPEEVAELQAYGVERLYSPADGQRVGLQGLINDMLERIDSDLCNTMSLDIAALDKASRDRNAQCHLARLITELENDKLAQACQQHIAAVAEQRTHIPVLGITGTGGAGKSSLTDELIRRFRNDKGDLAIAVLALDPSKRKSGGALLGDRIRMNAIDNGNVFFRSLATRSAQTEIIPCLTQIIQACKAANFDLVIVETPGIGQGDAGIVPYVDCSLYVMTPEFGAASQLEKIDMLDFADIVAINKFDRRGADDALRDVRKQMQRNREAFGSAPEAMPVYGTIAAKFNDEGVSALYQGLLELFKTRDKGDWQTELPLLQTKISQDHTIIVPGQRQRYLADIVDTIHSFHQHTREQAQIVTELQQLQAAQLLLGSGGGEQDKRLTSLIKDREVSLDKETQALLEAWPSIVARYLEEEYVVKVRDKEIHTQLFHTSLSGTKIPKVSLPKYQDKGQLLNWLKRENLPGHFPFTAGTFPFKRQGEDPGRMFAGEGDPFRTNRRFKYLSEHAPAKRLSTAFDSVTLYGCDPHERPDIYGKIGNSGVSVATLDDMHALFDGFDLCDPKTSVSMTINGPAPTILAMFLCTAIDQQLEKFIQENKRMPSEQEAQAVRAYALQNVRGTVQADILKEDQGQNTCIFSTEFSLRMMGDIQAYFVEQSVRNFYSVSISGYHIAEAGANPISQLAFTLANGFTYVEAYLARGLKIDDFAPNLSFFFSNGMDPEYTVMGRVARRIWAIAMRERYGANARSQKLKYHIQTSGRSLHAQEMAFNDIRTTLEALEAIYDNCNSLHTNAYDEALTTPTEESVRRAQAIQLIINKEWGLAKNENPNQGAFIIDELTDLVEEAVLQELERISERGGVLGAMETGYQRGRIQEESLYYEMRKHDGSLPLVGVNTFRNPHPEPQETTIELARSTEEEKQNQIKRLHAFQSKHKQAAASMLERIKQVARKDENVFAVLMDAVRVCSLGQLTEAFFEVGGQYRRNM